MTERSNATTAPLSVQDDIIDPIQRKRNFWEDIEGTFETKYKPLPEGFIGKNPATNQRVSSQCREKEKYLKHIYLTPSMKRNDGEENTVFKNSLFGDVCEKRLAATYNGTVLSEEDKSRFYEREIRPGTLLIPECGP
jgi:hypothetical protein